MSAGVVLAIIIVCVLVALAAGAAAALELRQMMTRRQFGPEYDRLAEARGHRGAQAELAARRRRVAQLGISPLPESRRAELRASWSAAQEHFVDAPADAVTVAAELVLSVATELGYPSGDQEQLMADLSVGHARRLDSYRRAEETAGRAATASTEDLRQALLWYRAMFRELAESGRVRDDPAGTGQPAAGGRVTALGAPSASAAAGHARRRLPRLSRPSGLPRIRRPSHPTRVPRPPQREGANPS